MQSLLLVITFNSTRNCLTQAGFLLNCLQGEICVLKIVVVSVIFPKLKASIAAGAVLASFSIHQPTYQTAIQSFQRLMIFGAIGNWNVFKIIFSSCRLTQNGLIVNRRTTLRQVQELWRLELNTFRMYNCGQKAYNPPMKFKTAFLALILAAVALPLAHSQTQSSPAPSVAKLPTLEQWQDSQIQTAAKDFQLAEAALAQAKANVETARLKLMQIVNQVGVARKLDPKKVQFNFQTLKFEAVPTPVSVPAHQNLKDKK